MENNQNQELNQDNTTENLNTSTNCDEKKHCCCLNKHTIPLYILNIILLAGIIVLFVFHFKGNCKKEKTSHPIVSAKGGQTIVYFNRDSLMEKYEMVKDLRATFEASGKQMEASFASKQKAFEKEAVEFQEKVQRNGFLTPESAEKEQQRLLEKQQKLYDLNQELTAQLANQELELTTTLHDTIANFLQEFNIEKNYSFILAYSKGSDVFFADKSLDITKEILDGLNEKYKKTKQKK